MDGILRMEDSQTQLREVVTEDATVMDSTSDTLRSNRSPGQLPARSRWVRAMVLIACLGLVASSILLAIRLTTPDSEPPAALPASHSYDDEAAAVAEIESWNGDVVRETSPAGESFVTEADLSAVKSAEDLRVLARLPRLRALRLQGLHINDAHLEAACRCESLEKLELFQTDVTDAGVQSIGRLTQLRQLNLAFCYGVNRDRNGGVWLANLVNLENIDLSYTKTADEHLALLGRLTKLRDIDLTGTRVTGTGIAQLKGLSHLEELDVSVNDNMSNELFDSLKLIPSLKNVGVRLTKITEQGIEAFRKQGNKARIIP